jgi:hypothetical protein
VHRVDDLVFGAIGAKRVERLTELLRHLVLTARDRDPHAS